MRKKITLAERIVENLSTAVLWFDSALRLEAANPAAEALLEISQKQKYGLDAEALFPGSRQFTSDLRRVAREHCPIIERGMRLNLFPGHQITVDCSISPADEPAAGLLVELVQVDQRLRLCREENQLARQQATHNVVRGLAHEIKNPLSGLRGAAQLLKRELPDPGLQEYTDIIIEEADRLQTLLNYMLGPRTLPRRESVNIHKVLWRARKLILSEASEGVEVKTDFDPSIPEFSADADQLYQAILNIMRNAVQAMNGHGKLLLRTRIERNMTVGGKPHKLVVRVDIDDNGPGIPEDMLEQIFYPMVSGRAGGTGLGLSIAQTLVSRNGGFIVCSSRPGNTLFTLWLPAGDGNDK
ncbi:MAG: PAS domain-containing protein [Gammaproteobacteria bacterium]|nr:PAS domain-containing protein [Gammaproteobacteria bacterium]